MNSTNKVQAVCAVAEAITVTEARYKQFDSARYNGVTRESYARIVAGMVRCSSRIANLKGMLRDRLKAMQEPAYAWNYGGKN